MRSIYKLIIIAFVLILNSPYSTFALKPKVVVLANSIDYALASEFFGFLNNKSMDVVRTTASDFGQYKSEKFIVILGGPDAYEGVGEIVQEVLESAEENSIREKGNKKMYVKSNVWSTGQVVFVIAGSGRNQTKEAHEENREQLHQRVQAEMTQTTQPPATTTAPLPTTTPPPTTSPSLTFNVVICQVIYNPTGQEPDNEEITLCNRGASNLDLGGWRLSDGEGSYIIPTSTIIPPGGSWTVLGLIYNPTRYTSGLFLNNNHDEVMLYDPRGNLIDAYSW